MLILVNTLNQDPSFIDKVWFPMLLFTEEKTRHETMIRKQFIKIDSHGKVSLNGTLLFT